MTLQKKVRKLHRKMMWQMKDDHKNGNVFQEDGSFCRETLYIRNHRLTEAFEETSEEEVIDAAVLWSFQVLWIFTAMEHMGKIFLTVIRKA